MGGGREGEGWLGSNEPTLSTMKLRKGWGTQFVIERLIPRIHGGYAMASRVMGSNCNWFDLRSTPIFTCAPCRTSPLRILMARGS